MEIIDLKIKNFKSIREIHIKEIEHALILVGKNNTGKTAVLDAIRAVFGAYKIQEEDFQEDFPNIEIHVQLRVTEADLKRLHEQGRISSYRRYDAWERDFRAKIPSYQNGVVSFTFLANREGKCRYADGVHKQNSLIPQLFPNVYYIDAQRRLDRLQEDILMLQEDPLLKQMRSGCCMFDKAKKCNHCFSCLGLIYQKTTEELNAFETAKLLEYKLYQLNLDSFSSKVNRNFQRNGGSEQIYYSMNRDIENMLTVTAEVYDTKQERYKSIHCLGKGMRSIYMLSLLETCEEERGEESDLILIEDPEIFLHPKLQRVSGDILYRLSRASQVIFSTHSPNLLSNFTSKQIRQMSQGEDGYSMVYEKTDMSALLDDLGYSANDLMNVNFVFIVEGKQDKTRLPLLLKQHYSELYDAEGNLVRVAIITTNSCTNIKTYANLKYMNQIYLKDNFLMIRDGDGKDREMLKRQLCQYYEERNLEDIDKLPRVTEKNVLILKYYSFENYFLNPKIMEQIGVVESEDEFYERLLQKWKEYLHKMKSGKVLQEKIGQSLETVEDVKAHMEEIKTYVRGHNLYDIFYGRFKDREQEVLSQYIACAGREEFADIFDAIDRFLYFESRKKREVDTTEDIR